MASLGDTLRERRAALGVSLEQAEAATRIRSRLLLALENGDYDVLPNPGYVRGYISSYARFLELDPQALLQLYKAETGQRAAPGLNLPQIEEAVARTGEQHTITRGAAWTAAAVVAIVALVIWGIVSWTTRADNDAPEPVPVTGAESTRTADEGADSTAASSSTEPSSDRDAAEPEARPFELTVRVSETGASWVRVTVDGRRAYEGTLTGGQSKSFQAARDATVRVGKPSAVTITRDGRSVTIPEGDTPTVRLEAQTP